MSERSVASRTARGAIWVTAAKLCTRAIDFVTLLFLARLLSPSDFGLVAIGGTVMSVIEAVLELPIGAVLTRVETLDRDHLDTAFTLGLLRGCALSLVAVLLALPIAAAYHDGRVAWILMALAIAPAVRSLGSPRFVERIRRIDYRASFAVDLVSKSAGLVAALAIAFTTHTYSALVANTIIPPCIATILSYAFSPYRPHLSLAKFQVFSGFLIWTSLAQALTAFSWQCDRLILGIFVPYSALGRYTLADNLSTVPEQALVKPATGPLLPAFALVRGDRERLGRAYLRVTSIIVAVGLPVMLTLAVLARPLVQLLLGGGKWAAAAPILQWLAIAVAFPLFYAPLPALVMALGRTKVFVKRSAAEIIVQIPLVLIGAATFGTAGVIAAKLFTSLYVAVISLHLVKEVTGLPLRAQLIVTSRAVLSSGIMVLFLLPCLEWLEIDLGAFQLALRLGAVLLAAALIYCGTSLLSWRVGGRPPGPELDLIRKFVQLLRFLMASSFPGARGALRSAASDPDGA